METIFELLIKKLLEIKSDASQMKTSTLKPVSIPKPQVPKIVGVASKSKKDPTKIAEQAKIEDPQLKQAQHKVAENGGKLMVKSDNLGFEDVVVAKNGQWDLKKSAKIEGTEGEPLKKEPKNEDNDRFHMHEWDSKKGYKARLSDKAGSKKELMEHESYGREDKNPHKDWNEFVNYHKEKGLAPQLEKVTPK